MVIRSDTEMFRIEMMPAACGDSFLITYGEEKDPHHVLIDGGPYYVYHNRKKVEMNTLRKRIGELVESGEDLELWVMTHVDNDHIEAAIRLLNQKPSNLQIDDVWFNGYHHLIPPDDIPLGPAEGEIFGDLIKRLGLKWNKAFGGESVALNPDQKPQTKTLEKGGLKLTLLSPTLSELYMLKDIWWNTFKAVLKKYRVDPSSSEASAELLKKIIRLKPVEDDFLGDMAKDKSEWNASSIAFIAEYGEKRCLFAGDAHSSVLESSLKKMIDQQRGNSRVKIDAFKIPHHGSRHNLSQNLLELVDCKKYLISTNGKSSAHHPHKETIKRIISHGGSHPYIYFNYRSKVNEIWDKVTDDYTPIYPKGEDQSIIINL